MEIKRLITGLALTASLVLPLNSTAANPIIASKKGVNLQELAGGYSYINSNSLSGVKMTYQNSQLILESLGKNQIEGLIIEGGFEVPSKIWKERWDLHNRNLRITSAPINDSLLGIYLLQNFLINKKQVWKQPSGKNYIWFGDLCNPYDSFDAWYIGEYPASEVPHTKPSIPLIPTFIPNNSFTNLDYLDKPWLKESSAGEPKLTKIIADIGYYYRFSNDSNFLPITNRIVENLSVQQLGSLQLLARYSANNISSEELISLDLETLFIKDIKKVDEGIKIIWNSYENYLYDVLRTTNLNLNYDSIATNIPGKYPETEFIDTNPPAFSGFYKINGEKISP